MYYRAEVRRISGSVDLYGAKVWGHHRADSSLPPHGLENSRGRHFGPAWQWNHNLDTTQFSLHNPGLTLHTATVTEDLYAARNTLTRRLHGANPYGVVEIGSSNLADGDHAGLAALKDASPWIGIVRNGTEDRVVVTHGLAIGMYGGTTSTRTTVATTPIIRIKVWLKVSLDAAAVD
ncbi:hypothetical protein IFM61392_00823 [Aspergillus lentulus]|uniref:Beta-xylosidase C-terminal Concanavalin A-like domain-containing protein n=1 Tax=Aspergillus lentulus TaxID=293939 RepID=A0ABQ0ZWK8_ASPLE|nr:hypothetical protein IFM60648_00961 [Aspergillus lentulus]GFF65160.1 hypothetical protein IFM62136_06205 [Aspergillus lentulus]GFF67276.1 hypothetical protein IFM47457_01663 [Aspergillus lentulus]GFF99412.1 hypothetical protein IFM61392_00823 [Aspergillus lentulus]